MDDLREQQDSIIIEPSRSEDVAAMVNIHIRTNPDAYLTYLGRDFLFAMYRCFMRDPRAFSLVARDQVRGGLAGVAIGCVEVRSFYRKLSVCVAYPYMKSRLTACLRGRSLGVGIGQRYRHQAEIFPDGDIAYFTQLNVSPDFQRRRVGSRLAGQFYREVSQRGIKRVYLITDEDNFSVRKLHEKMGCVLEKTYTTPADIKRCLYKKDLSEEAFAHLQ
jgi:ribosomal protein S18 acetylase RimI-like enzyme